MQISVVESKSPCSMLPILRSAFTATTNAISADHIICPYPTLSDMNVALPACAKPSPSEESHVRMCDVRVLEGTDDWRKPCGYSCPSKFRSLCSMEGIGIFAWGSNVNSKQSHHTCGINNKIYWRRRKLIPIPFVEVRYSHDIF